MQLRYCRIPGGNFGDDVNTRLWPSLFPDLADHHPDAWLYGVGTILGGARPDGTKVVLGSGMGYRGDAGFDDSWRVYWVRGPRTAAACGLDPALGLGDGAVLWDGLQRAHAPVPGRIGLVPHHKSYDGADWDAIAHRAGLFVIDPRQSPEAVTAALASCERVLTESLHGAIFADAMGVPWRAVVLARRFHAFKWQDWLDTLGMTLHAVEVPVELQAHLSPAKAVGNRLARWVDRGGPEARNHLRPLRAATEADIAGVVEALQGFADDHTRFACSDAARRGAQVAAMRAQCARFAREFGLTFAG